jgi:glycosyltransferase involved in cell wall biosynthesis
VTVHVVHVLYSFPDVAGKPGIGMTAFHQVEEVSKNGVEVTLCCTSLNGELPANVRVVQTLSFAGRRIPHRALGIDRSYAYHDRRAARTLERLGAAVDLVHCWPRATIHTSRVASDRGIASLREVPNTHTRHAFEVVAEETKRLGLPAYTSHSHAYDRKTLALEEAEYEHADFLLVPSDYSRRTFSEQGVADGKLVLHRYGFDPDRCWPPDTSRERQAGLTAIFVGRCEPRKGLHLALRAWFDSGASKGGRFIVCGSFDPPYRELLEPQLADPSVEIHGFVTDPSALMRDSDVLILPSLEEGSALVTYEAQACGCVLAVSEAAGARCQDGVEGLVHAPGDTAALTEHLRRLAYDRALLDRLRNASLSRIADLSWSAAGHELAGIYADVVTKGLDAEPQRPYERNS